jgi:hypothetical protein
MSFPNVERANLPMPHSDDTEMLQTAVKVRLESFLWHPPGSATNVYRIYSKEQPLERCAFADLAGSGSFVEHSCVALCPVNL